MGLYFGKDGVLRKIVTTREPETGAFTTRKIALQALEAARGRSLFLSTLHGRFALEDGIEVGEILRNLAPWTETVSELASMDLGAYLAELERPASRETELSHIRLEPHAEIGPVPAFDRDDIFDADGNFNIGAPVFTGRICLTTRWDVAGVLSEAARDAYDGAESVSLSLSPLRNWHHLPVVVSETGILNDTTGASAEEFLGTSRTLTDPRHPNVRAIRSESSAMTRHEIDISIHDATAMEVLFKGLLHDLGFHGSPAQTDAVRADLEQRVAEIDGAEADTRAEPSEIARERDDHAAMLALFDAADARARDLGLPVSEAGGAGA